MITAIIRNKENTLVLDLPTAFTTFMKSYSLSALCSHQSESR